MPRSNGIRGLFGIQRPSSTPRGSKLRALRSRRLTGEPLEARRMLSITVDTLVDELDGSIVDGDISLRDAIALAPSGETIDFSVTGTILLELGELRIDKDLSIDGPGAHLLTIDASGNDPTPDSTIADGDDTNDGDGSRVFNVDDDDNSHNIDVAIGGLTLTGGDSATGPGGGAILAWEGITISDAVITGNITTAKGGGLYISTLNGATSTITNTIISHNARSGVHAVTGLNSSLAFIDVTVSHNNGNGLDGAGIWLSAGEYSSTTITGSTITGNTFGNHGGGIWARTADHGSLSIADTTIANNTSRRGGAIFSQVTVESSVSIARSTLSGNIAGNGGAIRSFTSHYSTTTISDSTISGNSTTEHDGGGARLDTGPTSSTRFLRSTVTNNMAARDGGGIWVRSGDVVLDHTIAAGNHAGREAPDIGPGTFTASFSLVGDNSDSGLAEAPLGFPDANGNLIGDPTGGGIIDPKLAPLADNGGLTLTHALLIDSPARNAGDPTAVAGVDDVPEFDQRGLAFDRVLGAAIDIGAFEATPPTLDQLLDHYVDSGVLTRGQAKSLAVKLSDRPQQAHKPKKILPFVNHVDAFVRAGILTAEQGDALIDAALQPPPPAALPSLASVAGTFSNTLQMHLAFEAVFADLAAQED